MGKLYSVWGHIDERTLDDNPIQRNIFIYESDDLEDARNHINDAAQYENVDCAVVVYTNSSAPLGYKTFGRNPNLPDYLVDNPVTTTHVRTKDELEKAKSVKQLVRHYMKNNH